MPEPLDYSRSPRDPAFGASTRNAVLLFIASVVCMPCLLLPPMTLLLAWLFRVPLNEHRPAIGICASLNVLLLILLVIHLHFGLRPGDRIGWSLVFVSYALNVIWLASYGAAAMLSGSLRP